MKRTPKELFQDVIIHNPERLLQWNKIFGAAVALNYLHISGGDASASETDEPVAPLLGRIFKYAVASVKPEDQPNVITLFSNATYVVDNTSVEVAHMSADWPNSEEKYAFVAISRIGTRLEIIVNTHSADIGQAILNEFAKDSKKQD